MKLLLLIFLLLLGVVRGEEPTPLGRRARRNADNRSLKSSKGGLFSTKKSNIFSKSNKGCDLVWGVSIDPANASVECQANLDLPLGAVFACSHGVGANCPTATTDGYTSSNFCLAAADATGCYNLGGGLGEATVQVKAAWDWSNYDAGKCASILTKAVADPVDIIPFDGTNSASATAGACFDSSFSPQTTTTSVDSTVTITLDAGNDANPYTGTILPGGTVCEIDAWDGSAYQYTGYNKSKIPFNITMGNQDYEGYIEVNILNNPTAAAAFTASCGTVPICSYTLPPSSPLNLVLHDV